MLRAPRSPLWLLLLVSLCVVGCATPVSDQTRFYRLNTQIDLKSEELVQREANRKQPSLGVGPIRLASYLDRPQIINRVNPYQLNLNDFDHWAGTLQENIITGLVESLQNRLGRDRVIAYPWHRAVQPEYEIGLDVSRFDAEATQLFMKVRWTLLTNRGDDLLDVRQIQVTEPIRGSDAKAYVAAASLAVDQLAQHLATALKPYLSKTL